MPNDTVPADDDIRPVVTARRRPRDTTRSDDMLNTPIEPEAYLHSPARAAELISLDEHTGTAAGAARALYLLLTEFSLDDPRDRYAARTLASTIADHTSAADLLASRLPVPTTSGTKQGTPSDRGSPKPSDPSPRPASGEDIEDLWRLAGAIDLAARGLKAMVNGSSLDPEDVEPLVELTSRLSSRLMELRDAT